MLSKIKLGLLALYLVLGAAVPIPQDQAFVFVAKRLDANSIGLEWTIKPNYFLYQQRIRIDSRNNASLHIGTIIYPEPLIKMNQQDQRVLIYRDKLALTIPLLADMGGEYTLIVDYQGCSDQGFCYPPATRSLKLSFNQQEGLSLLREISPTNAKAPSKITLASPSMQTKTLLGTANPLWIVLSFFGFGLLLAFTPCMLPMIPVLSGIIMGQGHKLSTRKAFLLSLSYVLSMSLTYGIIGAMIATLGANLQIIMQSPWVISGLSMVLALLALSMFDYYPLRLPTTWQTKLNHITRRQTSGHYWGAAVMGALSILVLSPCITPPLIGALSYISEAQSATLGLCALFCLGLGMGTPLLLLGASAGRYLPKVGSWMDSIKAFFGLVLLGLAVHLLSRIVSPLLTMLLWSALFIISGLALKPLTRPFVNRSLFPQVLGLMSLAFGLFILYGASAGHTNPWQPLENRAPQSSSLESNHPVVKSLPALLKALENAQENNKPAVLDFYATWCDSCQQIEKNILQDARVLAARQSLILIQVDLSGNDQKARAILQYFKVIAPPTFIFYNARGQVIPALQWEGMIDAKNLSARMQACSAAKI